MTTLPLGGSEVLTQSEAFLILCIYYNGLIVLHQFHFLYNCIRRVGILNHPIYYISSTVETTLRQSNNLDRRLLQKSHRQAEPFAYLFLVYIVQITNTEVGLQKSNKGSLQDEHIFSYLQVDS